VTGDVHVIVLTHLTDQIDQTISKLNDHSTDPNLGLSTDPSLGLSTDPNLGLSTDPNLDLITDPNLGLSTDPNLGQNTDPNLNTSNQNHSQHTVSVKESMILSAQLMEQKITIVLLNASKYSCCFNLFFI
jgi:hypothetical protein